MKAWGGEVVASSWSVSSTGEACSWGSYPCSAPGVKLLLCSWRAEPCLALGQEGAPGAALVLGLPWDLTFLCWEFSCLQLSPACGLPSALGGTGLPS